MSPTRIILVPSRFCSVQGTTEQKLNCSYLTAMVFSETRLLVYQGTQNGFLITKRQAPGSTMAVRYQQFNFCSVVPCAEQNREGTRTKAPLMGQTFFFDSFHVLRRPKTASG